ncbi:hypothetical protein E0K89_016675 [Aquicoccus sp. SCR17]|nr:hypothetical protein [Carideicomes alvinocaridis]
MTCSHILRAALLAGIAPFAAAAQGLEFGPEQPLGDGTVRTFTETNADGLATRIGVEMSHEALASLGHDDVYLNIPLPEAASDAGYDHVSLNWMAHGHPPAELFGAPHFDVHFYLTTEEEQMAIDPSDPRFDEKAANRPAPTFMPANYAPPPVVEAIPAMGEHWVDTTDPVFSGQPFEGVLIYGAWDGEVTFVEPMVTLDLLTSGRALGGKVGQPELVAEAVSLPNSWSVSFDAATGTHRVSIDDLAMRMPGDKAMSAPTN